MKTVFSVFWSLFKLRTQHNRNENTRKQAWDLHSYEYNVPLLCEGKQLPSENRVEAWAQSVK